MTSATKATIGEVLFAGGGELGERMRAMDWSKTALGPVETWSLSLRTCVRIVLTSRQPMFVWWGPELINLYNDAYKAIVGGKHPQCLGQPAAQVWHEIWEQVGPRARSALHDNEGTYDEALLLIMERNGYPEETYYTFSYSPVLDDDGQTAGILCANSDDTLRIIGERQLKLLRDLASSTIEARDAREVCQRSANALATDARDLPFTLLYLLDEPRQVLRLRGASGIELDHPAAPELIKLQEECPWPIQEVLSSGEMRVVSNLDRLFVDLPRGAWDRPAQQAVLIPLTSGGDDRPTGILIAALNPLRLFDDGYRGFMGLVAGQISSAIAHAEAYQQELRRSEALAEIDRAKTAFFSNVSHEFRTPLTLMLGPLEDAMVSPGRALSPENLETAYRNALRLLKLVNALLDFSRLEAGRADARFEPTDLAALTTDLAGVFRSAIERAGLTLEVEAIALEEPIYVDQEMWEKIVLNLLSNALKFTFEGSIKVRLTCSATQACLEVIDTGSGIPSEELPNVFKRFHRVSATRSRTHEGTGIGLALVTELVRLHGGTIDVESEFGSGSTFRVCIPRGRAHLPADRVGSRRLFNSTTSGGAALFVEEAARWLPDFERTTPTEVLQAPPMEDGPRQATILLADDNADMRDYLTRLLRQRWSVRTVADGEQALASIREHKPDLVLSDVMMPVLDGFGLLKALRSHMDTRDIPFIMLSARAGDEARSEGLEAGADDYLIKPFAARELMARVSTHLQLAELRQTAERERKRLFDIFMQAPVPVAVLIGPELRFEVANPSYCAMVGRDVVTGQTVKEAFPELLGTDVIQGLQEVLRTGRTLRVDELHLPLLRAGILRESFFNYVAHPLRSGPGQADGVVVVAIEVTEAVLARTRISNLKDEAERASRAKDEFLSTLSHELRTPLNAIVGWSGLLRRGALDPERATRAIETIERNAQIQARLVEDMLDLSRIEQGKLVLSVGPLEMVRVVEAALEAVRPAADAKGVRLQPVLDSHATIVGDADRLQQVVWNLLSNAIKFTPRGGRVHVRLRRYQSYVEIAVADTGQGISADFLPHVFERFRQADPTFTRRVGGLGLGLAIVRSLVELHGGTVDASSDGIGAGATFVVKLPTAPLRADNAPTIEPNPGEPRGATFECPPELKGLQILVVDDEAETRELLTFVIEQCEAKVTQAASAKEALALLERDHFDLLVSDVGMPEQDGYTLMRALRQRPASQGGRMPALALTAYARPEDRTMALKAGFSMHLAKPIEPSELLVVIGTLITQFRGREQ